MTQEQLNSLLVDVEYVPFCYSFIGVIATYCSRSVADAVGVARS